MPLGLGFPVKGLGKSAASETVATVKRFSAGSVSFSSRKGKLSLDRDTQKSTWAEPGCENQLVVPLASGLWDPRQHRALDDEGGEPDKQLI